MIYNDIYWEKTIFHTKLYLFKREIILYTRYTVIFDMFNFIDLTEYNYMTQCHGEPDTTQIS